ncbi:hypothetical protein GE21DRAFT_1062154 [Neurospora crassa]|nr:hypothetical protein GE21DRAFT_1062154 [Neurospora crassa]
MMPNTTPSKLALQRPERGLIAYLGRIQSSKLRLFGSLPSLYLFFTCCRGAKAASLVQREASRFGSPVHIQCSLFWSERRVKQQARHESALSAVSHGGILGIPTVPLQCHCACSRFF